MKTMFKTLHTAAASTAILTASFCALAAGLPGENPVQSKYMSRSGPRGSMCAPQGTLKELVDGKYQCYGLHASDACGASYDAAKGKLDPKFIELFVDLMKTNRDGHLYAAGCSDLGKAAHIHLLSIGGLSYAKANLDLVLSYGTPASFDTWAATNREAYIAALGRYGDAQKVKILPILKTALATNGSLLAFKKNALKLMARFESDDGVAYCLDVLKQGTDKDVTRTCGWYLGERKKTDAAPILVRRLSDEGEMFTRALGLIGSPEGVAALKEEYEKQLGSGAALKTTAALLNIGDKSADYAGELSAMIQGKRPLSRNERQRKAEELKKKRKGAAERWKTRENETDEQIARDAALEATYVTSSAAAAKINAALKATAARSDWPKASTLALSALAQRGDKAAGAALAKLLDSPKEEVREIAVNAFGAKYDTPEAFLDYVGRKGFVVDASAVPALMKYIENEPKKDRRADAVRALGVLRSFIP